MFVMKEMCLVLRPLLAEQAYALTAIAEEETLLYGIKVDVLQPILESRPKVAWYLAQSFAVGARPKLEEETKGRIFFQREMPEDETHKLVEIQSVDHSKAPVTCTPDVSVQKAAQIMAASRVGSIIIVDEDNHPQGIITDRDLRNKIVTGTFPMETEVAKIMSQPVKTIPPHRTVADVQIAMMKYGIHHLVLTENGRIDSPVVGVISEHDLLVIQGNNPAIFIREISRSKDVAALKAIRERSEVLLKKYLLQEVSIGFICSMISEINDALIRQVIRLSEAEMAAEKKLERPVKWCWLSLGSGGREEQLLRTDQDNALIFEDVPEEDYDTVRQYFLALATKITDMLNECGFEYCPGEMMASNPKWCMSLKGWKSQFSEWIFEPTVKNIMFCNIFFDYRPIYGDTMLTDALTQHIFSAIEDQTVFLPLLAQDAIKSAPPLTFFRNFVVEKSGEHKDEFDIKGRAMMPLADAARVLILDKKALGINNTFRRFDYLAEIDPNNRALFEQAADAYEILVRYRALQGLRNQDSGRYFNPSELTKMERLNLRNSFRPIRQLQDLMKIRFRLNLMI